ncbi:Sec1 family domain-containing protein 2 [Sesbania bispinosa]|nr:Sec1 family domain-containing protein 2 [Sesbania bispinosa]
MQMAHSAYPDSPLGPDAYHEYESLLVQDYEELIKKSGKKPGHGSSLLQANLNLEDGGRLLPSSGEDVPHVEASSSGRDFYEHNPLEYSEDALLKLDVSVHHFPMTLCPISPRGNSYGTLSLPFGSQDGLENGNFSLGDISKTVGKILTDMSSLYDVGRRKRSAGLLLIDRTLDLLTPCCHGDSLVDRMFSSLPRRNRTTTHAQGKGLINLSQKIHDKPSHSDVEIITGSFVSSENFRGTSFLEAILDRRTKDAALLVKKWLQETLRRENVTVNVKSRPGLVTKPELQAMIKALTRSQSSFAVKLLSVVLEKPVKVLTAQICDLINKSALLGSHVNKGKGEIFKGVTFVARCFAIDDVGYIWLVRIFPTSGSEGHFLARGTFVKRSCCRRPLENPPLRLNIDDFDDDQWGKWGDEDEDDNKNEQVYGDMQLKLELRDRVDNFFKFLHKLSNLKRKNLPLRDGSLTMEGNFDEDTYMGKD